MWVRRDWVVSSKGRSGGRLQIKGQWDVSASLYRELEGERGRLADKKVHNDGRMMKGSWTQKSEEAQGKVASQPFLPKKNTHQKGGKR